MAIEAMAEELAKSEGYFTETRVPFKKDKGNSDFDVLGYHPKNNHTLVIECKAWGSPENYTSFNNYSFFQEFFQKIIDDFSYFKSSPTNHWGIKKLNEMWFVIPGSCDYISEYEADLLKEFKIRCRLIPIHQLIFELLKFVRDDKDKRRKRYNNAALEFCRWFLRSYENGKLDLNELKYQISDEKETYRVLKTEYVSNCIKMAVKTADKRNANIKTRIKVLKILSEKGASSVKEIEEHSHKLNFDLNSSRINVGLGTWLNLGIVIKLNDKYLISESFKSIIRDELKNILL